MKQKSKDDKRGNAQQDDRNLQRPDQGGFQGGYQGDPGQSRQSAGTPEDDLIELDETEEVQQSTQREGMGRHRHSNRGNEQNLDGAIDIDDLGSHRSGVGKSN